MLTNGSHTDRRECVCVCVCVCVRERERERCLVSRDLGWVPYTVDQRGRDLNEAMNFSYS